MLFLIFFCDEFSQDLDILFKGKGNMDLYITSS